MYENDRNIQEIRTRIQRDLKEIRGELNIKEEEELNKETIINKGKENIQEEGNWKENMKNDANQLMRIRW